MGSLSALISAPGPAPPADSPSLGDESNTTMATTVTRFEILKKVSLDHSLARVGCLSFTSPRRKHAVQPIQTPNFISISSRGSVPHMTPDIITKHTTLQGSYFALEDFVELSQKRKSPALYHAPSTPITSPSQDPDLAKEAALHFYTATPASQAIILAPRRHPAITAPMGNGSDHISLFTSTGFQKLKVDDYRQAVEVVKPDIAIPLADLTYGYHETGNKTPNPKRQVRMVDRTEDWMAKFLSPTSPITKSMMKTTAIFAPTLPVPYAMQWDYLNRLNKDHRERIAGLAIYDADILPDLKDYDNLEDLPRLSVEFMVRPQQVLRQVQLGMDLFTVPFLNVASDAGIAMTFKFPPPVKKEVQGEDGSESGLLPLGIDMWDEGHRMAVKPLVEGCTCYVCTKHHRAFLQHLLNAKEMLGWTLLQIHNHHIMSEFFTSIRVTLAEESPETFDEYCRQFNLRYENELPKGTGERPRARGYHFKSEANQPKINMPAWQKYDNTPPAAGSEKGSGNEDKALAGEKAGLAVTGAAGVGTETPVVPEDDAAELVRKGFAEKDEQKQ